MEKKEKQRGPAAGSVESRKDTKEEKDPSCVLKGDLGRLPGGGEVWLTLWNVSAGGRGRRDSLTVVAGLWGQESQCLGRERPGNPVL